MTCWFLVYSFDDPGFPGGTAVKNHLANAEDARDWASTPGLGRFPEEGNPPATHSEYFLPGKFQVGHNPWDPKKKAKLCLQTCNSEFRFSLTTPNHACARLILISENCPLKVFCIISSIFIAYWFIINFFYFIHLLFLIELHFYFIHSCLQTKNLLFCGGTILVALAHRDNQQSL